MDRSVGRNSDRSGSECGSRRERIRASLVSGSELGSSCFVSGVEWIGASLVSGSELGSSGCVEA